MAQLSCPHKRMFVKTVPPWIRIRSFAGSLSLQSSVLFITTANAPTAEVIRLLISVSSFNERVKVVPSYYIVFELS